MISACVVDTDVVSRLFRNDSIAGLYEQHLIGRLPLISFMTLAEIRVGVLQARWGAARTAGMERFLQRFVLHLRDSDICTLWAIVVKSERKAGRVISSQCAWIAATVLRYDEPLIAHERRHFPYTQGLQVISESWRPAEECLLRSSLHS